jgi:hypothetical protein
MFATTKLRGDALTAVFTDTTELPPHRVGQVFQTAEGNLYRFCQVHDPNTVGITQYDAVGYEADQASDGIVTPDISESDAGLFAGAAQANTTVTDDDYIFVQIRGLGSLSYNPTSATNINAGDSVIWDLDGDTDVLGAASNDVAGKCATAQSGLSTGVRTTISAYIQGVL